MKSSGLVRETAHRNKKSTSDGRDEELVLMFLRIAWQKCARDDEHVLQLTRIVFLRYSEKTAELRIGHCKIARTISRIEVSIRALATEGPREDPGSDSLGASCPRHVLPYVKI